MNTEFHKINLNEWNRAQYFYYFTKMLPTGYSLTSNIDITQAYNALKNKGKKFFPAYLYICSKIISEPQNMTIKGLDVVEAEKLFSKCAYGDKKSILDQDHLKDLHDENSK